MGCFCTQRFAIIGFGVRFHASNNAPRILHAVCRVRAFNLFLAFCLLHSMSHEHSRVADARERYLTGAHTIIPVDYFRWCWDARAFMSYPHMSAIPHRSVQFLKRYKTTNEETFYRCLERGCKCRGARSENYRSQLRDAAPSLSSARMDAGPGVIGRGCKASNLLMPTNTQLPLQEQVPSSLESHISKSAQDACNPCEAEHGSSIRSCVVASSDTTVSSKCALARRLLEQARILQSSSAGVFCLLPLGFRALKKIENWCHAKLQAAGAVSFSLPSLVPLDWLTTSGGNPWTFLQRKAAFGSILYTLTDRQGRSLYLPPTGEEGAAVVAASYIRCSSNLPLCLYQIGPKFRDEPRARASCIRAKEFIMLDAYSFHETEADRSLNYELYDRVLTDVLESVGSGTIQKVKGDSGPMGGAVNHEYHVTSLLGEDHCACPGKSPTLELGHIFQLPSTYCEAFGVRFTDSLGRIRVPLMNCYGLGLSRLLGHLALKCSDSKGIVFPSQVSPFTVTIIPQPPPRWATKQPSKESTYLEGKRGGSRGRAWIVSQALYSRLQQVAARIGGPCDVLLDDRPGLSLSKMQAHADLIGIPHQILVKSELLKLTPPRVIYIDRSDGCPKSLSLKSALSLLHTAFLRAAGKCV